MEKQYDSSKIKTELFFITVENESPKIYALQFYFMTDHLDVLAYIAGCEVMIDGQISAYSASYPLSYGVPVRERYGSTLLPATREQHDQNCTQSH